MVPILCCIGIAILIFIIYKTTTSYQAKVNDVLNFFREKSREYNKLAEGYFEEQTNGKKISQWDAQHKIDYIINKNIKELTHELKKLEQLKAWWKTEMPKLREQAYSRASYNANSMFILGFAYRSRVEKDLNNLIEKYNPDKIKFRLLTYTFYDENTPHYDPNIHSITTNGSTHKSITFYIELTPNELIERINTLAQYNFSITEYQYNCENQRKIVTQELRNKVIERDKSICQICGKNCSESEIEIDHIKPISKGGKSVIQNLQVLCKKCNRRKSNKWIENDNNFSIKNTSDSSKSSISINNNSLKNKNSEPYFLQGKYIEIGDEVKLQYLDDNEIDSYKIVENYERNNVLKNVITSQSAVGKSILYHKENDIVDVKTNGKSFKVKIIEIKKNNYIKK